MYRIEFNQAYRQPGFLQRLVGALIAIAVLSLAFFLGLFVFVIALGMMFIGGLALLIARFRRRRQKKDDVLEGDYIVIQRQRRK